ncbi:hypothetical protein EKK58_09220 [Candidatus Dependentiae bacterium]|nr:MAG: hypothetical protein EKK58_09220 [Candidatus Dependentiae bacterium]
MTNLYNEEFDNYVIEGERITANYEGFELVARIEYDDNTAAPDKRDCGFWPSMVETDAGFMGHNVSAAEYKAAFQDAERVIDDWKADKWFYCGVVISVAKNGVMLDEHAAACWGYECNLADKDGKIDNSHLTQAANELASEAVARGRTALKDIVTKLTA